MIFLSRINLEKGQANEFIVHCDGSEMMLRIGHSQLTFGEISAQVANYFSLPREKVFFCSHRGGPIFMREMKILD